MSIVCLSHANDFGLFSASEWTLLPYKTIQLQVQRGDILQSLQGTVWITVDGQRQDLLLSVSDMHTVAEDAVLRVSGFDESRLMVVSALLTTPLHSDARCGNECSLGVVRSATRENLGQRRISHSVDDRPICSLVRGRVRRTRPLSAVRR